MRRLGLQFALGLGLAAVVLWYLQAELLADAGGWAALVAAVRALPPWALPAYALAFLAVHLLRTLRWMAQVSPLGERDWRLVFRVCVVGYAAIVLFPFRLGELVRPYLLSLKSPRVTFSAALGTAVVERVVDGLVITGLLFLAVATAPNEGSALIEAAGRASALVFLSATGGLALFVWKRAWAARLLALTAGTADGLIQRATGRSLGIAARIEAMLDGFVVGCQTLAGGGVFLPFVGLTAAYWATNALGIWLLAVAFGIPLPLSGSVGVLAVLVVGLMVPSASGFVGTFQLFLTEGLKLYVLEAAIGPSGLAFALTMNVVQIIIQVGFAVPFMRRLDMSFGDLFRAQAAASESAEHRA